MIKVERDEQLGSFIQRFVLLLRFLSCGAQIIHKKILQKYICRTFRNMFAYLVKIHSLYLPKYICWMSSWELGQQEITFMQATQSSSAAFCLEDPHVSTERTFDHTVFFSPRLPYSFCEVIKSHQRFSAPFRWHQELCSGHPQGSRQSWTCHPRISTLAPAAVSIFWGMTRWNWIPRGREGMMLFSVTNVFGETASYWQWWWLRNLHQTSSQSTPWTSCAFHDDHDDYADYDDHDDHDGWQNL